MTKRSDAKADLVKISKTLSYWLRHKPHAGGLSLDSSGWAQVSAVLEALKSLGLTCNLERLQEVVATNDKQRFELSPDGAQIRARQGHSLPIAHEWPKVAPPELLYHGTSERFLPDIMNEGLKRMRRHHVHLSGDVPTARAVAARRSSPVVLAIAAREMETRGFSFFMTANGVWLTEHVPPDYISLLS